MSNIKKNIIYNSVLTLFNYIVPLITFPYITRVLGVDKIGMCDFVDSIINYFCLFSMMGINTVGIREIARSKDKNELSKTFSSLLSILLLSTGIILIILIVSIFIVDAFYENRQLLYVGVLKLVFNSFLIEWFYTGTENFKYITIRSTIIRIIYVFLIFVFVREPGDYLTYYCLTVGTIVINAIANLSYSRNFVKFTFKGISFKEYLQPFLVFGVYGIFTSFYTTFNVMFLGLVGSDSEVGFYTTATKLHRIILALFTAFTGVMMPRMSSLIYGDNRQEFNALYNKSINVLYSFAFPIICFCFIFADNIIDIIAGSGYKHSIVCFRIVLPLIFIIGLEQIQIFQILIPLKRDKTVLINSVIGGIVGLVLNFLIVPTYFSLGSSVVWLLSEVTILVLTQYAVSKYRDLIFPYRLLIKYIAISIPISVFLIILHKMNFFKEYTIVVAFLSTCIYYVLIEVKYFKNQIFAGVIRRILKKRIK